ncbi:hypothetical protein [Alkalicoccobacillus porphyridii]|uniref:Uncharacterized protein n=1 Tax=Alkalicoccobacillus porphyridii TaxID=2597270 RepID=A0A553ZWP0_9BACI|nr:hypothetical protein [Alkalicoccobacillus porphyridii]TSB45878.1 hypothetical protein FN960_13250 [Alkalicoccobacillus porphyridii]
MFRFKNKRDWYHTNVLYVAQLTLIFLVTVVAIILMQSLFVLNFENNWSDFARNYYVYHNTFLGNYRPLTYSIFTFLLLGLLLFLLGLIFSIITIWTNKPLVSLLIVMLLNIINIAVTIGKLETLSPFLFTNHLDLMNYMYMVESDQNKFPIGITIYWFVLIAIVYLFGYFFTNKVDFDVEKGEKKFAN